jgi:hypothetical protein
MSLVDNLWSGLIVSPKPAPRAKKKLNLRLVVIAYILCPADSSEVGNGPLEMSKTTPQPTMYTMQYRFLE